MKKKNLRPMLHLAICLLIAWMITNGWAYILLGLGIAFKWTWAESIGSGYLAVLWMPWTPEKLITIPIAIFLQKLIFPKDEAVGRWLKLKLYKIKTKLKEAKEKRRLKKRRD